MIENDVKNNETLLHPKQAARLKCLPQRRGGASLHIATIHRWYGEGLEFVRVGKTKCTTQSAMLRFFASRANSGTSSPTAAQTSANHQQAEQELAAAGI